MIKFQRSQVFVITTSRTFSAQESYIPDFPGYSTFGLGMIGVCLAFDLMPMCALLAGV